MGKILEIDFSLLQIFYEELTKEQLSHQYDLYNGRNLIEKAKKRIPISNDELEEFIEKQEFIKNLYLWDGMDDLKSWDVRENVLEFLNEKIDLYQHKEKEEIQSIEYKCFHNTKVYQNEEYVFPFPIKKKDRELQRKVFHYLSLHKENQNRRKNKEERGIHR